PKAFREPSPFTIFENFRDLRKPRGFFICICACKCKCTVARLSSPCIDKECPRSESNRHQGPFRGPASALGLRGRTNNTPETLSVRLIRLWQDISPHTFSAKIQNGERCYR